MYAIVDIAGQQFKVEKDQKIFVHRQNGEEGSNLFFDKVLLIDNGKKVTVGTPVISDALISARILSHLKGDKVKVFKKKRRKGYQILKGHRQLLTEIQIYEILEKGGSKAKLDAASAKPELETVAKGKKAKVTEPEISAEKAPEAVAVKEPVKKAAVKTKGKSKVEPEKKITKGKKETESKAGISKSKAAPAVKSTKTKTRTTKEVPSKKAKKSSEK
jgi:large subunit ribosomal protein L21